MTLDIDTLKRVVRDAITTHVDEISCTDCFERLDHFVEMALSGQEPARIMPHVHEHLERCADCREEFSALLQAARVF
jgi:hypothetical protein